MDGRYFEKQGDRQGKPGDKPTNTSHPVSFQAMNIDEKIGYPQHLGSSNVTELEEGYADVSDGTSLLVY